MDRARAGAAEGPGVGTARSPGFQPGQAAQHPPFQRVATPGGRDYGRLSVMLQWRYDIEKVLDVPPRAQALRGIAPHGDDHRRDGIAHRLSH